MMTRVRSLIRPRSVVMLSESRLSLRRPPLAAVLEHKASRLLAAPPQPLRAGY